jgi:hypothetical protein
MEVRGNNRSTFTGLFNPVGSHIRPCHWYRGRRPPSGRFCDEPSGRLNARKVADRLRPVLVRAQSPATATGMELQVSHKEFCSRVNITFQRSNKRRIKIHINTACTLAPPAQDGWVSSIRRLDVQAYTSLYIAMLS